MSVAQRKQIQLGGTSVSNVEGSIMLAFGVYSMFSQYTLLTLLAGGVFIFLIKNLWKAYVPPVFLFIIVFHWLQVFGSIVFADVKGRPLAELYNSYDLRTLFTYTFIHIGIMGYVFSRFLHKQYFTKEKLYEAVNKIDSNKTLIAYVAASVILPVIYSTMSRSAALSQIADTIFVIKSTLLVLLLFILFMKKTQNRTYIIVFVSIDFILSLTSFFSDFKTYFFLLIIIFLTITPRLKSSTYVKIILSITGLIVFMSFWSYTKSSYREYLNQGTGMQEVNVSTTQALLYMFQRAQGFDLKAIGVGSEIFLSRLQYMQRYAEVYRNVPEIIPHQGGKELEESITFLLVPRFLNPDKGTKDASAKTAYYTRRNFHRASQGTSISMGYFCDLFIDFGLFWMTLPLIGIALLLGWLYKFILGKKQYNKLFTYSLLISVFISLGTFESDTLYYLGMLRNNVAFLILCYAFVFPPLHKYIIKK